MTSILPPDYNHARGYRAASRAVTQATKRYTAEGTQISRGEVEHCFGLLDRYLDDREDQTFENKAKLAIRILSKDPTKEAVVAVLEHLGMNEPENPVIDPGGPDIIVRPRYGLMERARPIAERLNAPGASDPEDIAMARILSRLAEMGSEGSAPAVRSRRAFAPRAHNVRTTGRGGANELSAARTMLDDAIANATRG